VTLTLLDFWDYAPSQVGPLKMAHERPIAELLMCLRMNTPAGKVKIKISTKVSLLLAALRQSSSILLVPRSKRRRRRKK
jgi:hypothetical protein